MSYLVNKSNGDIIAKGLTKEALLIALRYAKLNGIDAVLIEIDEPDQSA